MKLQTDYFDALTVRCTTEAEVGRLDASVELGRRSSERMFMLESGENADYVAGAVGWHDDEEDDFAPSGLAYFPGGTDPARTLPS
jgi:hypothetical protein